MGGAGYMQLDPDIEASFSEGLVRVAKQTGAWVITGGLVRARIQTGF